MDYTSLFTAALLIASFISGAVFALILRWIIDKKTLDLEKSAMFKEKNLRSQQVKLDKEQKTNLAVLRAKELHDEGKGVMEIAKTVAIEYPDVAFDALRKAEKLAKEMNLGGD